MGFMGLVLHYVAPIFLVTSPITSYGDQIRSIHVRRSSRGFSLDTPLIMLVASILRCFYWLGANFELTLLYQSLLMIVVQLTLLKTALDHRPSPSSHPFTAAQTTPRPYNFWQWRSQRPYWEFLSYFTLATAVLQLCFAGSPAWTALLGYVALGVEATLPLPQLLSNQRRKSCDGFRLSVLASWVLGDAMKMAYFLNAPPGKIGIQFKLCAAVQTILDLALGAQFWLFGDSSGVQAGAVELGITKEGFN